MLELLTGWITPDVLDSLRALVMMALATLSGFAGKFLLNYIQDLQASKKNKYFTLFSNIVFHKLVGIYQSFVKGNKKLWEDGKLTDMELAKLEIKAKEMAVEAVKNRLKAFPKDVISLFSEDIETSVEAAVNQSRLKGKLLKQSNPSQPSEKTE